MKKEKKIMIIITIIIPILLLSLFVNNIKISSKNNIRNLDLTSEREKLCSKISNDFYDIPEVLEIQYLKKDDETRVSNLIDMLNNNNLHQNKFFHDYLLKLPNFIALIVLLILSLFIIIIIYFCYFFDCCLKLGLCDKCDTPKKGESPLNKCGFNALIVYFIFILIINIFIFKRLYRTNILNDVNCSLLKFIDDIYNGEFDKMNYNNITKWPGFENIEQKLEMLASTISNINKDGIYLNNLNKIKDDIHGIINNFENEIKSKCRNIISDDNYYLNHQINNYMLDFAYEFKNCEEYVDSEVNTFIGDLKIQYGTLTNKAASQISNAYFYFIQIINDQNIIIRLFKASNNILNLKNSLSNLKLELEEIVQGNLISINNKISLGINIILISTITFISFFFAYYVIYMFLYAWIGCLRTSRKTFLKLSHGVLKLSYLLPLLSLLLTIMGFTLAILNDIAQDFSKAISYISNIQNYNSTLFGNSSNIIDICLNSDGNILNKIDLDNYNTYKFENIRQIEKEILISELNILKIKNNFSIFDENLYMIYKRSNFEDINFGIKKSNEYMNLKNLLEDLNEKTRVINEEWNFTINDSISCFPYSLHNDKLFFNPKTCDPKIRYQSIIELEEISNYISEIVRIQTYASGNSDNSIYNIINEIKEMYIIYIEEMLEGINYYNNAIQNITNITKDYIGEDDTFFSFLNCKFIGNNIKIILKILNEKVNKIFDSSSDGIVFTSFAFIFIIGHIFSVFAGLFKFIELISELEKYKYGI